jgi:hypothetical protein
LISHLVFDLTHAFQVAAFLKKMAGEIDLEQISTSDDTYNGEIVCTAREPLKPVFEPMRRKLHVPGSS